MKKLSVIQKTAIVITALTAFANLTAAQETTPRPRIAATPQQTPTPRPAPQTSPSPRVSPAPSPTVTPAPRPVQTIAELQGNIRSVLLKPELQRGQVGVKIISLASGKTVFEQNAEKYFVPASNMKSFTVAAALDRLTPDFRFATSVYAAQAPDASGTIRGDLTVFGRGDPTFAASLNDGDYYRAVNLLADKIAAAGVKRVEGGIVGDESYFSGDSIQPTWEWDDLQWYYGARISALSVNDNAVDLQIQPGGSVGAPCVVRILPVNLFAVANFCTTTANGKARELEVTKQLGANRLEIRGTMPVGDAKGYEGAIAVENPAEMFAALLKNALVQKGIAVTGAATGTDARAKALRPASPALTAPVEIARHESAPFSYVAARTMKPSQNLYTELILCALGESQFADKTNPKKTSAERGVEVVNKFLAEAGIAPGSVIMYDGSGLSRHDLITPSAAVKLYEHMNRHRFAASWQAALTVGGVDGTLANRFKNTVAAGNVRGKTGTLDQVGTLSGYVTTASGERLAFSILTNNLPDGTLRRATMDEIVLLLANFNGKTM